MIHEKRLLAALFLVLALCAYSAAPLSATDVGPGTTNVPGITGNALNVSPGGIAVLVPAGGATSGVDFLNEGEIVSQRQVTITTADNYFGDGTYDNTNANANLIITYNEGDGTTTGNTAIFDALVNGNSGGNVGKVTITNTITGNAADPASFEYLSGATAGDVTFSSNVGAANSATSVNIGGANAIFGGATHLGAVTAGTVTTNGVANFYGAIAADTLTGNAKQTFHDESSYEGSWIVSAAGAEIAGGDVMVGVNAAETFTMGGDIAVNSGALTLGPSANYTNAANNAMKVAGASADSHGSLTVDLSMSNIAALVNNIEMGGYGEFSMFTDQALTFTSTNLADYTIKSNSSANSKLNFYGAYTLDGVTYDAKNAQVSLGDDTAGASVTLSGSGAGITAGSSFTVASTSRLLSRSDDAKVTLAANGTATINGGVDVSGGVNHTLSFGGKAVFGDGSGITTTAYETGIGTVDAQSFDFTAGTVNVVVNTTNEDDALGKTILKVNGVTATQDDINGGLITGETNFTNVVYEITDYGEITKVKGRIESFGELTGGKLNINEINLAAYTDALDSTGRSMTSRYLQAAYAVGGGDTVLARSALDQLGGEAQATALFQGVEMVNRTLAGKIDSAFAESMHLAFSDMEACSSSDAYANSSGGYTARRPGSGYDYCESTGQVWGGYVGGWTEQKRRREDIMGYKNEAHGVAVGWNRQRDNLFYGIAGAFMHSDVNVRDAYTKFDSDAAAVALYAGYMHESGLYGRVGAGYSMGWNDYNTAMLVGGWREGSYDSSSWQGSGELGYVMHLPENLTLVASAGANFARYNNDAWVEEVYNTNDLYGANWFDSGDHDALDIPMYLRLNSVMYEENMWLIAEGRVGWIYSPTGLDPSLTMGFVGGRGRTVMRGVRRADSVLVAGVGVTAQFLNGFDLALNYDYEHANKYRSHNFSANVRYNF